MATNQNTNDISYELHVLKLMLNQLPARTGQLIITQLLKLLTAIHQQYSTTSNKLISAVDDAILFIKLQEFDLEATKRERDELRNE